jgi:hypothetical protein
MREDVRAKKQRLNPGRGQRRKFIEAVCELNLAYERWLRSVVVAAGRDHRDGTAVLGTVRIRVDALV